MLKVYTSPSCLSCRKVKKYFKDNGINFVEKNIMSTSLLKEDIFKMLVNSENGFDDIISTRSKAFKDLGVNIDDMNIHDLMDFIVKNPTVLKRPIIVADQEIQVGYNEDDITLFLPPELRERECSYCLGDDDCDYVKEIKIK